MTTPWCLLTQNSHNQRRVCVKWKSARKECRDERRRLAEAAERDKENQADLANLFYHEDSEEELIVLLVCGSQTERVASW